MNNSMDVQFADMTVELYAQFRANYRTVAFHCGAGGSRMIARRRLARPGGGETMYLICVDLDDVIADPEERRRLGEDFADRCFAHIPAVAAGEVDPRKEFETAWKSLFYSPWGFYNPQWIALDRLLDARLPSMLDALERKARARGGMANLVFNTSRPGVLRRPTAAWLRAHGVLYPTGAERSPYPVPPRELRMKAQAFSDAHLRTVTLKEAMVQELIGEYEAEQVLVIENEPELQSAILRGCSALVGGSILVVGSVLEALKALGIDESDL